MQSYLTVTQLKNFNKISYLEGIELYAATIHIVKNIPVEEVRAMPLAKLKQLYLESAALITNIDTHFYPVIEWQGKQYGFSYMHKMTTGEYIDLDNLVYDTEGNIEKIMSILYRPITKNNLKSFKYKFNSLLKYWWDDVEDASKYYEIEAYDSSNTIDFNDFPAGVALGAINFFLQQGNKSAINTLISSHPHLPEVRNLVQMILQKKKQKSQLKSIMGGLRHSVNLQIPTY